MNNLDTTQKLAILGLAAIALFAMVKFVAMRRRVNARRRSDIADDDPWDQTGIENSLASWFAPIAGVGIICGLAFLGVAYLADRDEQRWGQFSAAHQCEVVGKMTGSVISTFGTTIGANGQVLPTVGTAVVPEKTGYRCNDGVTYWRDQ